MQYFLCPTRDTDLGIPVWCVPTGGCILSAVLSALIAIIPKRQQCARGAICSSYCEISENIIAHIVLAGEVDEKNHQKTVEEVLKLGAMI